MSLVIVTCRLIYADMFCECSIDIYSQVELTHQNLSGNQALSANC